jgi:alkyl hydroperoxide reductase subunit D
MQTLMSSPLGKANFELIAFVISSINGCPYCVNSHEKILREHLSLEQINEALRLASVVKAISIFSNID